MVVIRKPPVDILVFLLNLSRKEVEYYGSE